MPKTNAEPLPTGDEKVVAVRSMFDAIAFRYDALNHLLSMGVDRSWRRKVVRRVHAAKPATILDLATGAVELLPEKRSIDDQIEWLDDDTILYGMPREATPGDSDVWSLAVDGSAEPTVFLEHAWSPAVVRAQ